MSRIVSCALLTSLAIFLATSPRLKAADKSPTSRESTAAAREQVAAALRAELAGENDRRAELLATAARTAPDLAEANWHLGRVQVAGKWHTLDDTQQEAANDPQLAEYCKLRDETADNPKLLRGLARWCLKTGWDDSARLHYGQLLSRIDIDDEARSEAMKRLDFHLVGNRWLTGEQLKAQDERARKIEAALRQWRPRLKRLQSAIDGGEFVLAERAIKELNEIDDPHVILALESFQIDGGDRFCEEAVKRLAKFPQVEATEALVRFAVLSSFAGARDAAAQALKQRPKHDYVPQLLAGLNEPIKSQFSIAVGRNGIVQYTQAVQQENANQRAVNVSSFISMPLHYRMKLGRYEPGYANAAYVLAQFTEAQQAAFEMELQREATNFQLTEANRLIFHALQVATEQQLPQQPQTWWQWWNDYNQYDWPKPTQWAYQSIPRVYYGGFRTSCFLEGTLVRAQLGLVPVESLKVGDRVLSQDQSTGELAYKLVLRTTIRSSSPMIRIQTPGNEITATLGHPFWVNGQGWKMAKELKEGDLLHSLSGSVRVEGTEQAGDDKAYNLVVDDFNTYFVGQQGLLVHDNEFRKPTRAIVPGLTAVDGEAGRSQKSDR